MTRTDLKRRTINGFFWGLIESIFSQGQGILYGIILARILSVQEFGLIGMITIFIAVSQVFVDSGLNQALIRKQNCTDTDYSTVFWANILIGILFYGLIWVCSPLIAKFYNEEQLIEITRLSALAIIIGSLTLIQQTIVTKEIDFRTLTVISTVSTFVSGVTSIILAMKGFEVWSLVWRSIINQAVRSIMLWLHNKWYPKSRFSWDVFKELFTFGSNILFISLIATAFKSFYNLIIGKNYSKTILGYYTNSEQYSSMASNTISNVTSRVSYPVLSRLQDDNEKLKAASTKLVQVIMFTSFFVMFGLAAIAKPFLVILLGEKWLPSVIFFQALCIGYSITPMHMINQNIMKVKGRSDLFFKTEVIKYIIFIPILVLGIVYGLPVLITGFIVFYWISFFINALYSKKLIDYSYFNQFKDILPLIFLCFLPAIFSLALDYMLNTNLFIKLLLQGGFYVILVIGVSELIKLPAYIEIKQLIAEKSRIILNNLKK